MMLIMHIYVFLNFADPNVVNAIKWSKEMDRVFVDNYNRDPSLSWQYFGSSTGFMRQYPGKKWKSCPMVSEIDCTKYI